MSLVFFISRVRSCSARFSARASEVLVFRCHEICAARPKRGHLFRINNSNQFVGQQPRKATARALPRVVAYRSTA